MSGRFIAVVGPSGVGKDSVMEAMAARTPSIMRARRVITRPQAAGSEDFESVNFVTFEAMREKDDFALWWSAHGLCYGIPATVDDLLAEGRDVLANLSRGALQAANERFERLEVISLDAEKDVLAKRLAMRGRESAAAIAAQLEHVGKRLPDGLAAIMLDNSGSLDETVTEALRLLYPESSAQAAR